MALGPITVTKPATVESDATVRLITLGSAGRSSIAVKSGDRVFLGFDEAPTTDELQKNGTIFLDAGDTWIVPKGVKVIQHRAKTTTAILFVNPDYASAV